MRRMRVLLAIALLGFAGGGFARAADLPVGYSGGAFDQGQRSEMVWLYDNQPGVVVRPYWSAPWHYHHYFPYTGIAPRIGRYENLSAISHPGKPAKSYRRSWSNNWAFGHSQSAYLQAPGNQDSLGNQQDDNQSNSRSGARHRPQAHGHHNLRMH
jgi:hypothetical protein